MKVDEDYTEPALTLMRKALKGNGVRTGDVTIKNFDGAILEFMAAVHITLNNQITEKTISGKTASGGVFQNRNAAHQEANNYESAVLQKSTAVDQIKNLIDQKPYQGFGLDNEFIKLPFLNRDFVSQESCSPCHGKGRMQCAKCKGRGYEPCPHCNAQGFEECNECRGNRQVRGPQGQMQTCHRCHGLGKTSCSFCKENQQIQCSICRTKGETQCRSCGGHGAQSNIISAAITAQCAYDFDAEALPDKAVAVVKKLGASLAQQAQVTSVAKEKSEQEGLRLLYEVCVPQGHIEFAVKDQIVQAYLFGTKAAITEVPNFLDALIAPGIKKLARAVGGQGSVGDNIRAAVKYKTVRQAVALAARYNSKKAVKALLHYTPLGLSMGAAQKLVEDANVALNNATKQQRTIAVISGIGVGAALGALYFFSPLRSVLMDQISNAALHVPVNFALLGLCAGAGYGVWQALSSRARKQALESFVSSK